MKTWKEKEKLDIDNRIFWKGNEISELKDSEIFVMGTNPSGIHGAGAAKAGMKFGAKYGIGRGLVGQTYGLITKNLDGKAGYVEKSTGIKYEKAGYQSVSPQMIRDNIEELYICARQNPDKNFLVTYKYDVWSNGMPKKSLNGYTSQEMLEFFIIDKNVPDNIVFHDSYKEQIKKTLKNGQDEEFLIIEENGKSLDIKGDNVIWIIDQDDGNPAGIHGAGAAKAAMKFGAKYGIGRGMQGRTYALITKNLRAGYIEKATGIKYDKEDWQSVSKEQISANIDELYECVRNNPDNIFIIAYKNETFPNGSPKKSLSGYTGEEMFNLFTENKDVPPNIAMHESFKPLAKLMLEKKNTEILTPNKEKEEFTFFWKSTSTFSQWHPSIFEYKGIQFTSCEQFMMFSKAKLFGDEEIAQEILDKNKNPLIEDFLNGHVNTYDIIDDYKTLRMWDDIQKSIKDLGKKVKGFNEEIWVSKRESIISVASREKYKQNPDMKLKLLKTTGTTLVEASPYDKIYGIGMDSSNPKSKNRNTWNGLNLLGKILTDTRIRFENENKPHNKMKI